MSRYKLGDIAEIQAGPFGTQLHKDEYVESGILMLNAKNIGYGVMLTDSVDYVSEEVCERLPRYILKKGDILFGRAGSIDRHAYVDDEYVGCFQGTNCIRIRCSNPDIARYVSYYLWLPELKQIIENQTGGSILSYITTDLLEDIVVDVPDEGIMKKVNKTLQDIERKIKINAMINDNLQQMARMTYMHLFFNKKHNGKLGDIIIEQPKSNIQVTDAKASMGEIPFFTSGDAVLSWSSPLVDGRNCFLNTGGNAGIKFYVGETAYSTDTWCITSKDDLADYLYLLLDALKPEISKKFFQGTGLKHLQKALLKDRPIYIPSRKEREYFNAMVMPWLSMISDNIKESQQLMTLRDWLLPMLMNGQATADD